MHEEIPLPGVVTIEHSFTVPLDHERPDGPQISVFARELADPEGRDRPFLVFFQGGPGFEAPRPSFGPREPAFVDRALTEFRVLLLDQRGTGRSTPIGRLEGLSAAEQGDYLACFRADSIVRDAELIRQALGVERWTVLGQSFGGFCVFSYLSHAPEGLREALVTGGVPPLGHSADEVYARTYARVRERNDRYRARYPGDAERLDHLRRRLEGGAPVMLPTGEELSWRRFRQLGEMLGMSDGAERLHHLLELDVDSPGFAYDTVAADPFSRNPIYAVLHEACYGDGGATNWSADRMLPDAYSTSSLLTGEHVYPWMFEEYAALTPLREAAGLLAERDWPRLYDPAALAANSVPVAAVVYADDMYVERTFSEETAARVGAMRVWLTSEYDHNGLRVDGPKIFGRLLDLARGRI
jgi:pimeloyl-ACP methyl ester carboxylesterase